MAGYSLLSKVAVRSLASNALRENLVQAVLAVPEKGCSMRWATDLNAASIDIARPKMGTKGGREINPLLANGGYVNSGKDEVDMDIATLPLTFVYDACTDVPRNALDMNGSPQLFNSIVQNMTKGVDRFINCIYIGSLISANVNTGIVATSSGGTVTYATDTKYINKMSAATSSAAFAAIRSASANLNDGDIDNGFDIFPQGQTELLATSTLQSYMLENSSIFAGNYIGQYMVASGAFDADTPTVTPDRIRGFLGQYNGAVVYGVGSLFKQAIYYLGQTTLADGSKEALATTALDHVLGLYVCGQAVAGGIDRTSEIKTVDLQGGQGYQLQPNVRCGFTVFSPKGVQLITDSTGITASDFVTYTGSGSVVTQTKKCSVYAKGNRS